MSDIQSTAWAILDLFENLLDEKDITIPCSDQSEQAQREDDNDARIYGSEYFDLENSICNLLEKEGKKNVPRL